MWPQYKHRYFYVCFEVMEGCYSKVMSVERCGKFPPVATFIELQQKHFSFKWVRIQNIIEIDKESYERIAKSELKGGKKQEMVSLFPDGSLIYSEGLTKQE